MIADNVKKMLKEKKIQRKDLSYWIKINKRTLDQKLDCGRGFNENEIRKIKEALGVSYEELLD